MYQVVLNHSWEWASIDQRIWRFTPTPNLEDAEIQMNSMISRGVTSVAECAIACVIPQK